MRKLAGRTLLEVLPPKLTGGGRHGQASETVYFLSFTRDGILGHQINKRLESLLHAIRSAFFCFWRILKKTILFSDFKKSLQKNPRNKKTRVSSFCRTENKGRKPDKNLSLCPETSTKNAVHEFHLWSEEMSSKKFKNKWSCYCEE
jgi:hypothetical protein